MLKKRVYFSLLFFGPLNGFKVQKAQLSFVGGSVSRGMTAQPVWGHAAWAAGLLPCQGARFLPNHLEKLLFFFIFWFGFYWHVPSSFLTVSNHTGTDEVWRDQLEPSHDSCLMNPGISASCPMLSSDPNSPCLY